MISILETIKTYKMHEVALAKKKQPSIDVTNQAPCRDFINALIANLTENIPAIIAEIKKASPSKGVIREEFDVAAIAKTYAAGGACCLSVLTDAHFFQGKPHYLDTAKQHCKLPILRKDFIIDSYQIDESRALGADCILLIAALLDDQQLFDYCQQAQELGMAVLVESHDATELVRSLKLPTPLIGINNRSLHTFATDLQTSIKLATQIPQDRIIITESGINNRNDILLMQQHGIQCFLIGESLMRNRDITAKLQEYLGV